MCWRSCNNDEAATVTKAIGQPAIQGHAIQPHGRASPAAAGVTAGEGVGTGAGEGEGEGEGEGLGEGEGEGAGLGAEEGVSAGGRTLYLTAQLLATLPGGAKKHTMTLQRFM